MQGKTCGEGSESEGAAERSRCSVRFVQGMASRGLRVATHCLGGFGAPISPKLHKGRSRRIQQTRPPGMARWVRAPFVPSGRPEEEMERKGCRARQPVAAPFEQRRASSPQEQQSELPATSSASRSGGSAPQLRRCLASSAAPPRSGGPASDRRRRPAPGPSSARPAPLGFP